MSVSVKFIQIDGDAADVAAVLGTALGNHPVIVEAPAAPATDASTPEPPTPDHHDVVIDAIEDEDEPSADIVQMPKRQSRPRAEDVFQGEQVPGPFAEWDDIPSEWRWLSAAGDCMHVRQQPGLNIAMCRRGIKQIGARRLHDATPPAPSMVSVCGQCNKHIRIAHRKAAST